ncbi:MAG: thioredoxin domain-containing protein [Chakrabartia sp.]
MIRRLVAYCALMLGLLGVVAPATAQSRPVAAPNYTKMVTITPKGAFVLGNPRAKVRLVEYLSYTCSHCAQFAEDAFGPLKRDYIAKGLVALELRNLIRDQFDLTAALLARCGGPSRVFQLTEDILARQEVWVAEGQVIVIRQEAQWKSMPLARQLQTLAKGSGLLQMAQARGLAPAQANACLASEQMNKTLLAMTKDAVENRKINGTPSFLINDQPGPRSPRWEDVDAALRAALNAR